MTQNTTLRQASETGVPRRVLGGTGEEVSIVGLGGWHIGVQQEERESIRIVREAIDLGINFLDNAWDYNEGLSEIREGKALRDGYREKAFLMTKIDGRTRQSAEAQINESLRRLQTDYVDLMQFHEVIRMEDPERIFGPDGALQAMQAAREAGKIRYIGFTGHKDPEIHLKMLRLAREHGFHFDTVQMPLNVMDAHFKSFEKNVLPAALKAGAAVLGMKSMGDPFILDSKIVTPAECLHYAMSLPVSVVITGCESVEILHQAVDAAKSFRPLSDIETTVLLAKTEHFAGSGKFELYKTTDHFDSTEENPEWLG